MQVAAMPGGPEAVLSGARARLRISRGPLRQSWVGKSSTFRKPLPSLYTDQQQRRLLGWGGEGSAKDTFADEAPVSSKLRNVLPSGVICHPELSRKTNL
jgi:hypothetical protein